MIKKWVTALAVGGAVAVPAVAVGAPRQPAQQLPVVPATLDAAAAAQQTSASDPTAGTHYTIGVRLSRPSCPAYWNLDTTGEHASGKPGWVENAVVQAPSGHGTVQATVGWRYNVNSHWALIASHRQATPYWGFIERSCLASPPNRILSGHAHDGGWSTVHFQPAAGTVAGERHLTATATVRDGPNGYVIGNLGSGDTFQWTHRCGHHGPWIFGWAPKAHTWGWILAVKIGNPCTSDDYPDAPDSHPRSSPATPAQSNLSPSQHTNTTRATAPPASAHTPAPAAPAGTSTTGGPSTQCYPQYTVTEHARARATRAGTPIGDVEPGAHVNVRSNDGVWLYGYISQVSGGAGGFGWLLDEKVTRTGTFCD
ncbi:putative secreted protein [Candidatus Protofrankia californiensis]|uniref:Putative secreted protein n=1 Tax=Candidatus Protofrankia californiensis TaxID=1839754 RepID=A0A1C3NXB3_9ACTN|nr:putative secreted protein [Candidatus Protofrankia californiensis]